MRKANEAIFLPIFLNKEGKKTYNATRIETQEINGKQEKVLIKNDKALDDDGKQLFQAMNRAAKRILQSQNRDRS